MSENKEQLTRQQLLARIAWYEMTFHAGDTMRDMTQRDYANLMFHGMPGYYSLTTETLQTVWDAYFHAMEFTATVKWDVIDELYKEWAVEPVQPELTDYQLCEKASSMATEFLELLESLEEKGLWEPSMFNMSMSDVNWSRIPDRFQEGFTQKAYKVYQEQDEKESEEFNSKSE